MNVSVKQAKHPFVVVWLAAIVLQFYFAGTGLIGDQTMKLHANWGWTVVFVSLPVLARSLWTKPAQRSAYLFSAAAALVILQPVLVLWMRRYSMSVAALHAVDGLIAVVLIVLGLAQDN